MSDDDRLLAYVVNEDGCGPVHVANFVASDCCPAWAAGGQSAFRVDGEIYAVSPDGPGLTNLTNDESTALPVDMGLISAMLSANDDDDDEWEDEEENGPDDEWDDDDDDDDDDDEDDDEDER